jgi:hypothetical protein
MFKKDVVLPSIPGGLSPELTSFCRDILQLIKDLRVDIVQREDWIPVTYINSWVDYDATRISAYYKDILGYVHLMINCKNGSSGLPFTMLEGYRPAYGIYRSIVSIPSGTTVVPYAYIQPDGTVTLGNYTNNYCFEGEWIYRAA